MVHRFTASSNTCTFHVHNIQNHYFYVASIIYVMQKSLLLFLCDNLRETDIFVIVCIPLYISVKIFFRWHITIINRMCFDFVLH